MEGKLNLIQVSLANYSRLQKLLHKRLPASAMLLNILQLQLTERVSEKDMKFYVTGENLDKDETPIVIAYCVFESMPDSRCILFSLPAPHQHHQHCISHCGKLLYILNDFIDWKVTNLFGDVPEEVAPKLLEFYQNKPGSGHEVGPEHCRFYWMDISDGLQVKSVATEGSESSKVKIQPLTTQDAEIVDKHWGESREGMLQVITQSIAKIGSFGVYALPGEGSGVSEGHDLVSWVFTSPLSSINALYTREDHRRKGYGEMALREIVRHNAQIGLIPVAHVLLSNSKSQKLMEKVGLKSDCRTYWLLLGGIQD